MGISKLIALADAEEKVQENKADTAAEKEVEKIKGDRISDYLLLKLQTKFGGSPLTAD